MFREGRQIQKSTRCSEKTHVFFPLFYQWFITKNQCQIAQKSRKLAVRSNIHKKICGWNALLEKKKLNFGWFLLPSGFPGTSQDVPGASQNPSILSLISGWVWKSAWSSGREAPGSSWGPPRHLPGTILDGFSIDFSGQFPHALCRKFFPLVPRCEMRYFWKSRRILLRLPRNSQWLRCCMPSHVGALCVSKS